MIEMIKRDTVVRGLITGLFVPFIGFYFFKLSFFSYMSVRQFWDFLVSSDKLSAVISLAVIFNAFAFFLFLRKDCEYSARGVLGATLLYAIVIVVLKMG